MNKLIIVAALIAAVTCEPPVSGGYGVPQPIGGGNHGGNGGSSDSGVDDALLARVAQILASGGDGSSRGGQTNDASQYVDESVFSRVAQLLNEGGSSGGSSSGPSDSYGAPASRSNGQVQLGQPEVAQRIAEFALQDTSSTSNQGGYDAPAAPAPVARQSGGAVTLGRPEVARRVADFSAGSSASQGRQGGYAPPQARGGYN